MAPTLKLLLLAAALALAEASPKVVPMKMHRHKGRTGASLYRRNTVSANLGNAHPRGLYFVNTTVGNPGQMVQLQIDTGSSDVWMFGPRSCDSTTSPCLGGNCELTLLPDAALAPRSLSRLSLRLTDPAPVDGSQSNSATLVGEGNFKIQYQTPGSGVSGNYFTDDFAFGGTTVRNLTMAVATQAVHVSTGIMGIGFNANEAIVGQGGNAYPNVIDEMVSQGLINTHAYSLHLDDLEDETGTVLFGGYDKAKYKGDLTTFPIQPDARTGTRSTMTIAWTSLSVTDASGTTFVTPSGFAQPVVLDSGATYTLLPQDLFNTLANYFGAVQDNDYGWLVPCNISSKGGQIDYGFNGPFFSVAFDQLAVPLLDDSGSAITFQRDNSPACKFGINPVQDGGLLLFGDTFLRSQYVVYDLDNFQISIAPTKFNVSDSQVVEIQNGTRGAGAPSTVASVAAAQTATELDAPGFQTSSGASGGQVTGPASASVGVLPGPKTTVAGIAAVGTAATSSSKAGSAHAYGAPFLGPGLFSFETLVLACITGSMMLVGSAFVAVF